jgi:hypothetical protein
MIISRFWSATAPFNLACSLQVAGATFGALVNGIAER